MMAMRWLWKLTDKLLFTSSFIAAMQLPEFIHQYRQRLGGHLDEARNQLASYQLVAERNFDGNLQSLVEQYQASASSAFRDTGEIINELINRVNYLETLLTRLELSSLPEKIWLMSSHLDSEIAQGTMQNFIPGMPMNFEAIACGLVVAIFVSILINGFFGLLFGTWRRRKPSLA